MLTKQAIPVNFSQGLDLKTDPFQVTLGKFLNLENSIFDKGGLLQKRNGYGFLAALPNDNATYVTTFNGDLTAVGTELLAYSAPSRTWIDQANIKPIELSVLPIIRSNLNQSQSDSVVAPNGFVLTAYMDQNPLNLALNVYKYVVCDSVTGQNIVPPTVIVNANVNYGNPRVFLLGNYFIIAYISNTNSLQFIAVSSFNPLVVTAPANAGLGLFPSTVSLGFDGVSFNGRLYFMWQSGSGVTMSYITSYLEVSSSKIIDVTASDIFSLSADSTLNTIWAVFYNSTSQVTLVANVDINLNILLISLLLGSGTVLNLASQAENGLLTVFFEFQNFYSYDSSIPTHYIEINTVTSSGAVGTPSILVRSVGLASKAFLINGDIYVLTVYQSPYQTTYFLIDVNANIVLRLAYENGGGYLTKGLPFVTVIGNKAWVSYLIKDLIFAVNKNTNVPAGSQVDGIYAQTGINLVQFTFASNLLTSAEIGLNLNLNSGITAMYDGYSLTEQGFFLYPDSIELAVSTTAGFMTPQEYFYQVTYEWSDNQGNLFRSAPSIPVSITLTSANTSVNVFIPTLRLSLKNINNPVKLVVYRWSAGQEVYYQTTSIILPTLNNPLVDSITFNDTNSDATILGDNILYTTGGVVENIGPPTFDSVFLFDSRLWGIVSEDKNLLWYSKQIIENTPVEMSDLLTFYVSPTIGAQGSTGVLTCGSAMDDKLILFKSTAINYINGTGPDNTGANNGYSQAIFVTATVGCSNQHSIVFQPQGLMFEFASDAGNQIWLLGRDLSTTYVGAPVELLTTNATVLSSVNVPGTNQVRFTMSSGITLMYDYYYGQWGTFVNVPAVSSVLYQGLHTYINSLGQVFQETQNLYLDGGNPVVMSFTTSWLNLAGLQGYERAYFFYILGVYYSPHKLNMKIAYDYNPAIIQQTLIQPDNYNPNYGVGYNYGNETPYGGTTAIEQWKIYLTVQRCQSFQITLSEIYDPFYGVAAGPGLTVSGLNIIVGLKRGFRPTKFTHQAGSA